MKQVKIKSISKIEHNSKRNANPDWGHRNA